MEEADAVVLRGASISLNVSSNSHIWGCLPTYALMKLFSWRTRHLENTCLSQDSSLSMVSQSCDTTKGADGWGTFSMGSIAGLTIVGYLIC